MKKFKDRGVINRIVISPFYSKYASVPSAKDGVLSSTNQYIEYSAKENIKSVEFSLGNLIAIGADRTLSYVSMSLNSDMNFVDEFALSYQSVTSDVQKVD